MAKETKGGEKKRLVILDTHAILHRAYHALPDFSSSKGEPTGALYGLISMLLKLVVDLKPDYIVAAFDLPGGTFRHEAFADYKSHRVALEDALVAQITRSRDVLDALGVTLYEKQGYEADDVIGTIAEMMKKNKDVDVIIASGDMDTLQLVDDSRVRAYTLRKGLTDVVLYDDKKVLERYGFGPEHVVDYKGLRGDPSDNIPGVKGVGEKTATQLIVEFGSLENIYKVLKKNPEKLVAAGVKGAMLEKLKNGEEMAEFSKELATIKRDVPIDFKLGKPWREEVSSKKVLDMLEEFNFRSLIPRVRTVLGGGSPGNISPGKVLGSPDDSLGEESSGQTVFHEGFSGGPSPDDYSTGPGGDSLFAELPMPEGVTPEEIEKVALAVWVIDSNITAPTLEDIYRVGKSDKFEEARKNILDEIKKRDLSFVYEKIELPLIPVLRTMEERGVKIDKAFLADLSKKYKKELDAISKRIFKAAGTEFNISSPKQLGDILFDTMGLGVKNQRKTATGARTTKESELEKLRDQHPIIGDILSYRELSKLLGTYIDTIPTLVGDDGRLHTTFVQTGTSTGRLGSQNPNLQNIPIKTDLGRAIRHAFVADQGYKLLSFDYSQIELRIAAIMSDDASLIDIFKEGRDVHTEVAARVFHVRDTEVNYEMRRRAKVINFGILYGMGVTALQQSLGTNRKEAQEFYDQYFAAFPRLASYIDEIKADAARVGYTKTLFGRRRYFDGIKSPIPYVRAAAERMAINAPIQGTATGDIPKLAMIEIGKFLHEKNLGYLLLQVHDELVFEIKEDKVDVCAPMIREIMEGVLSDKQNKGVPITVEGKVGSNWGDMQKL